MLNKITFTVLGAAFIFSTVAVVNAQSPVKKQKQSSPAKKQATRRVQNVKVEITEAGYQPSIFKLKRGVPARLTFVRRTEDECGKEVVIRAYNIRRALPLNKLVTINFTPRRTGSFSFVCGMDMMRGKVIVQ